MEFKKEEKTLNETLTALLCAAQSQLQSVFFSCFCKYCSVPLGRYSLCFLKSYSSDISKLSDLTKLPNQTKPKQPAPSSALCLKSGKSSHYVCFLVNKTRNCMNESHVRALRARRLSAPCRPSAPSALFSVDGFCVF